MKKVSLVLLPIMEIRERILLKANDLFKRYGFRRVTMDEIALKTGMSKKTIYQSFANKDEIVDAIVEDHLNKSISLCEENAVKAVNAVHEILLNLYFMQEQMAEMDPSSCEDLEKFFPAVFLKMDQYKNSFMYKKVRLNVERGVREGLYREELNVDVATKLKIESMFIPFNQSAFPVAKYNFSDVNRELLEIFLYGFCTPEGQKQIKKYKQIKTKN